MVKAKKSKNLQDVLIGEVTDFNDVLSKWNIVERGLDYATVRRKGTNVYCYISMPNWLHVKGGYTPYRTHLYDDKDGNGIFFENFNVKVVLYDWGNKYLDNKNDFIIENEYYVIQMLKNGVWKDVDSTLKEIPLWNSDSYTVDNNHYLDLIVEYNRLYEYKDYELEINTKFISDGPIKTNIRFKTDIEGTFRVIQRLKNIKCDDVESYKAGINEEDTIYVYKYKRRNIFTVDVTNSLYKFNGSKFIKRNYEFIKKEKIKDSSKRIPLFNKKYKIDEYVYFEKYLAVNEEVKTDPLLSISNTYQYGHVRRTYTGSPITYSFVVTNGDYVQTLSFSIPASRYTDRGYLEYNVTAIPNTAQILNVTLVYDGDFNQGGDNISIRGIANKRPSISGAEELWNNIGNGTLFVPSTSKFPVSGGNQAKYLGPDAINELDNQLLADWFGVSIKMIDETVHSVAKRIKTSVKAVPFPTLNVTYEFLAGNIEFNSMNIREIDSGEYVFAGESYIIDIVTRYNNQSSTIWFYDGVNNLFNVTVNYYDNNSIIVEGQNIVELLTVDVSTNSTGYVFTTLKVLLTNNIVDILDVDVHYKLNSLDDHKLIDHVDDFFNIYNLGGFTETNKAGFSGRIEGGDVFEIFSADTRVPTLVPLETFTVRETPLGKGTKLFGRTVIPAENEEDLIDEMKDWNIYIPVERDDFLMNPTNRLPNNPSLLKSDRAYNSYPFGFRLADNDTSNLQHYFIEKKFMRTVTDNDNETVYVSFMCMIPDDSKGGSFKVYDYSLYENLVEGAPPPFIVSEVNFQPKANGTCILEAFNLAGSNINLVNPVDEYSWYNVTIKIGLRSGIQEVFLNDVLKGNITLATGGVTQVSAFAMGIRNTVVLQNDFYMDDLKVVTDFNEDFGGNIEVRQIYRKFQGWHMKFGYGIEQPDGILLKNMAQGYIEFGVDCVFDKSFEEQIRCKITPVDVKINDANNWIQFKVEWFKHGESTPRITDYFYSLYQSSQFEQFEEKDASSMYLDIWMNKANNSRFIGGRLNQEFYGMSDTKPWWAIWTDRKWSPKLTDKQSSDAFFNIEDIGHNSRQVSEIKISRIWAKVYRNQTGTFKYIIQDIEQFDILEQFGGELYRGIDTPELVVPITPDLPTGGIVAGLKMAISNLGKTMINAVISAGKFVISGIDDALVLIGLESGFFSRILSFVGQVPEVLLTLLELTGQAFTYLLDFITTSYLGFIRAIANILWLLGRLVQNQLVFWNTLFDLLRGGNYGQVINLWTMFQVESFITLIFVFLPYFWVIRLWNSNNMLYTVRDDIKLITGLITGIMNLLYFIIKIASDIINLILNMIPL